MKAVELLEDFRKMPMFTINELSRMLRKDEKYVRTAAYRLESNGLIKRVERGKYTVYDDPLMFASCITVPSYISFWTALRIYNLTEQLPGGAMVAVTKPKKEIEFNGERITFTKTRHFWGYTKMRYRDFDIMIAEKEKSVIDCMLSKNTPFDEAAKAVMGGELDYEKLIEYVRKTGNGSLAKRIGFLIEKHGRDAGALLGIIDSNYIPLNWSLKSEGRKDFRWKIVMNTVLDDI